MHRTLAIALLALSAAPLTLTAADTPAPQQEEAKQVNNLESLRSQIKEMIAQLEKNDPAASKAFIEKYATPEDLEKLKEEVKLEDIAKAFHEQKRTALIEVLKSTSEIQPAVSEDQLTYTFTPEDKRKVSLKWDAKAGIFHIIN